MSKKQSASNSKAGKRGELLASAFLQKKGYTFVCLNYRYKRAEIDLIVSLPDLIVFVEVKYRTNILFGFPETFVTPAQQNRIRLAADNYLYEINWHGNIRFDVVSIVDSLSDMEIIHFEDCFN